MSYKRYAILLRQRRWGTQSCSEGVRSSLGRSSLMPVCVHCLKLYDVAAPTPCKTHPGSWQGSERGKLHGTSSSDPAVSHLPLIVYAWDCCGSDDPDAEGCVNGAHRSFDDG